MLQKNIAAVIMDESQADTAEIDEKLKKLEKELVNKAETKEAYDQIADEIFRLREKRNEIRKDAAARNEQIERISRLQEFISEQESGLTEFDEGLDKSWIKSITVYGDRFDVELKSGIRVEIEG